MIDMTTGTLSYGEGPYDENLPHGLTTDLHLGLMNGGPQSCHPSSLCRHALVTPKRMRVRTAILPNRMSEKETCPPVDLVERTMHVLACSSLR